MTPGRDLVARERELQVLALRRQRKPMREIADIVGISKSRVHAICSRHLDDLEETIGKTRREMVLGQLARTTALYDVAWRALHGDVMHDLDGNAIVDKAGHEKRWKPNLKSIETCLKISAQISRDLGLTSPAAIIGNVNVLGFDRPAERADVDVSRLSPAKVALLEALMREAAPAEPAALPAPDVLDAEVVDVTTSTSTAAAGLEPASNPPADVNENEQ